jgi:RNA polymerase sigma-70 factor (ECF subfamily)
MNWPYELGASTSTLQKAFDCVVAQFQRPLAQYLYRFVFRQDTALDLTQETFVKAFQNLHRYDNARPFSTWLFSIASNLAKDHLRKHSRRHEVPCDEAAEDERELCFRRPDRQLEAAELGHAIEEAIAALPLLYREPLLLRHTAGLSVEQTAELLGITPGVVKIRLFRARTRLQESLGKEWLHQ